MPECHKWGHISLTNIKHLTFYLPFGYTHVDLKLDLNPKFQTLNLAEIQGTRINKMRGGNKMQVYSSRVKDVK